MPALQIFHESGSARTSRIEVSEIEWKLNEKQCIFIFIAEMSG